MNLTEQIFAQALMMAGALDENRETLLMMLCRGANNSLASRLREELQMEECRADLVAAGSLYALAALAEIDAAGDIESFTAGDVTVKKGSGSAAANCLRDQADLMIRPYIRDGFAFRGV